MVSAADAMIKLVGILNATGDAAKQAHAVILDEKINSVLTAASNLAVQDVIHLLSDKSESLAQLQALDAKAKAAAVAIGMDESKVNSAIAFATSAVLFTVAVVSGSPVVAARQLLSMLTSLNISV